MNRSHANSGHMAMNALAKNGKQHSSCEHLSPCESKETSHSVFAMDCCELLRQLPDNSVQLIVCDPPYNIQMATWDSHQRYGDWAAAWLKESERVLTPSGSIVIFGGLQFQDEAGSGDLLQIMSYLRERSAMRLVNLIVWHYANGMSCPSLFRQPA